MYHPPYIRTRPRLCKIPRYVIIWRELAISLLAYNLWKTGDTQKKNWGMGLFSQLPENTTCTKYNPLKERWLLLRYINKIHNYIEKLSLSSQLIQWSKKTPYQIVAKDLLEVKTIDFPAFINCGSRRVNWNHVI